MMGGLPQSVAAVAGGGDPPSAFSAVMRWKDGAQGVFLCDNNAGSRLAEFVVHSVGVICRGLECGLFVLIIADRSNDRLPTNSVRFAVDIHDVIAFVPGV